MKPGALNSSIRPFRDGLVIGFIVWISAGLCLLSLYHWTHRALIRDVRDDLEQFARIAAPLVDGDLHEQLTSPAQVNTTLHKKALAPLIRLHRSIPSAAYLYTCISVSNQVRFVLDTSTSSNELSSARIYSPSLIMDLYKSPDPAMLLALKDGIVFSTDTPVQDEFGSFMSGYAPIFNSAGKRLGIVGVDLSLEDYLAKLHAVKRLGVISFVGVTVLAVVICFAVYRVRLRALVAEQLNQQGELLRAEQQRVLRAVLDHAPLGIWFAEVSGRILFVNRCFCEAIGISEERFLATDNYSQLLEVATAQSCQASDRAALSQSQPNVSFEQIKFVDGRLHRLEITKVRMLDEAGQPKGLIGISLDVTERERVQVALRESEQRYRTLLEVSPDAFCIVRTDQVTFVNPAGLRLWGADQASQILGRHPFELFHQDKLAAIQQLLVLHGLNPGELMESTIVRLDGSSVEVEMSAVPFTDVGVVAIQIILRDVTYRKKLENTLRQAQKMEAIGTLSGGIAHDFNNLLAIIQGNAELALQDGQLTQDAEGLLRSIIAATERATALTRQLLTFSRKNPILPQPLDLNEVISKLVKMFRRLIREDIDLECHYSSEPIGLLADPGMMDQVLLNLCVNSRDAMPNGGRLTIRADRVKIETSAELRHPSARPGQFAQLTVSDTGVGIPSGCLHRIFEPFFTTKEMGRGTGLGLATVHGIVAQHQGWIEVESQPGQGTTFRVLLPLLLVNSPQTSASKELSPVPQGHEVVLLVEDEADLLKLISQALRRNGYHVLEAGSGAEALEIWKHRTVKIDLLLTDIVMPKGLGGIALAELLQAESPNLKILLTSGYSEQLAEYGANKRNPWKVLEKPCPPSQILAAVRHCLDN